MGVHHLNQHAKAANGGASANSGGADSRNVPGLARPASTSGTTSVPRVGAVSSFSSQSLHGNGKPAQPPKGNANGGRAGAKSGQPHLGSRGTRPGMSGGRLN